MCVRKIICVLFIFTTITFSLSINDYDLQLFKDKAEYSFGSSLNKDLNWEKANRTFFNVSKGQTSVWFRYKVPKDLKLTDPHLGIAEAFCHVQVYLDNKLIVNEKNIPYFKSFSLNGFSEAEYLYLRIYVENSSYPQVGAKYLLIGNNINLIRYFLVKDLPIFLINCVFIFIGIIVFVFYVRNRRSLHLLPTSILMISIGITFCLLNSLPTFLPIPSGGLFTRIISLISSFPIAISCFMLLSTIFVSRFRYMMSIFQWFYVFLYIISTMLLLFSNQDINVAFGVFRQTVPFATLAIIVTSIYEAFIEKNLDARIFIIGLSFLIISATSTLLISFTSQQKITYLFDFGYLFFLVSILWISLRKYTLLNKEVFNRNKELYELNISLEEKVIERTEQLEKTNAELTEAYEDLKLAEEALKDILRKHHLR